MWIRYSWIGGWPFSSTNGLIQKDGSRNKRPDVSPETKKGKQPRYQFPCKLACDLGISHTSLPQTASPCTLVFPLWSCSLPELDGTCNFLVTTWALTGTQVIVPIHNYSHCPSSVPCTAADRPFSGTTSELCCSTGLLVLWPHSSLPPESAGRFLLFQLSDNVQEKKSST